MTQKRAGTAWAAPTPFAVAHIYTYQGTLLWLSSTKLLPSSRENEFHVGALIFARHIQQLYGWVWFTPYRDVWDKWGVHEGSPLYLIDLKSGRGARLSSNPDGTNNTDNYLTPQGYYLSIGGEGDKDMDLLEAMFRNFRSPFLDPAYSP